MIHKEQQQLLIILLIVFIGFMGTSIAYPIFPPLFLHPAHGSIVPDTWNADSRNIYLGFALAAYPLGQFIGSPILGAWSDRGGRKEMLILSLIGGTLGYLLSALALYINSLSLLLLSRFVTGLMEGNFAIVRAMAADLQSISKYKSFGKMNAVAGIGYVMGPVLGGLLSDNTLFPGFSYALPFLLATILSGVTVLLAAYQLIETNPPVSLRPAPILWSQFNLIKRFHILFTNRPILKYLMIISSIFTLAVDIFYEFGPVYLTGLWAVTPAGIALYNAALSVTLAIGGGWLPDLLSNYFSTRKVINVCMLATAIVFAVMSYWLSPVVAFIMFALAGLTIGVATTNLTIKISNAAERSIQGEAMGAQLSLRMLGDAMICIVGGFVIVSSVVLPIFISFLVSLFAAMIYFGKRL